MHSLWVPGLHLGFPHTKAIIITITENRKHCLGWAPEAGMIKIPLWEQSHSSPWLWKFKNISQRSPHMHVYRYAGTFISSLEYSSRESLRSSCVFSHEWTVVWMQKLLLFCILLCFQQLAKGLYITALITMSACHEGHWMAEAGHSLGEQCPARIYYSCNWNPGLLVYSAVWIWRMSDSFLFCNYLLGQFSYHPSFPMCSLKKKYI